MADRSASPADERPRKTQKREKRRLQKHATSEMDRPDPISGETIEIQHGRLQAEATAADIISRGSRVTDADVLRVFRLWSFKRNDIRTNVIPEGQ